MTDLLDKPTKETPPARRLQYGRMVAGVGLVGAGLLWFLDRIDALTVRPAYLWAGALIVVGIALMVGSFEREHHGLVVLGVFVTIGALLAALGAPDGFRGGFGDQRIRVTSMEDLEESYAVAAGKLVVDLSDLEVVGEAAVEVDVTMGEMRVILPPRTEVKVVAEAGAGELILFGQSYSGLGVGRTYQSPDFERQPNRIVLDASVVMGKLEVSR